MQDTPETQFAEIDGLSIAYQLWGSGPRNIVLVPGMISHLEAALEMPGYRRFVTALKDTGRLAIFDKRGHGMSDRIHGAPGLEARVDDITAIMEAAGMHSATLIGFSEGASLSCLYAALHPERVERLVLCGGYARGRLARGYLTEETLERSMSEFRQNWGRLGGQHPLTMNGPGEDDPVGQKARARFERLSATPNTVAMLFDLAARIDISRLLPSIEQPTLVMHRQDEAPNGQDCAQEFVDRMPQARRCAVPGNEHLIWEGDVDSYLAPMIEFITGTPSKPPRAPRVLATILFSDLVTSTAQQARIGDGEWRDLMNRHDAICRAEVAQAGGTLVKFTGDGMLARFATPTSAVTCAERIREALAPIDLQARFGAHMGEIEIRDEDISGLGVVVAARIMDLAEGGQVLVSDLTRQLMLGAPYQFRDRGMHPLKGLPETWQVHEALPA
ncbi:MAG: adenylate/guanylate cyclase domain-containing protein [Sulfitobacter sp.]|nr:adenylate/guanylate cyclase domain-containing protein [Sulfitobacter sp.]